MPKINLLNILSGDSQTILIDKVNYNFDQILTAGGGPQGSQGIRGATGPIGPQGIQGPTGPQGLKGARWYVQQTAPANGNLYNTPWGDPELGDYWLSGETGANPYGVYVYNDLGGGTLGWDYSGVYINTQSSFTAVDDINLSIGERVLLHNTEFSHTYGLLLSDYGLSGSAQPPFIYGNLGQFGLNSERAKLKIATDPSSAMATLLSFGRADQDSANYTDPSYSQGKNPRFLWASASGYNLDFTNPGGNFDIRTPGNNFNVPSSVNISLIASADFQVNALNVSITRQGSANSFNNSGTGAYYAEGSVMRYVPNYALASGNFIVGDTVTTSGTKGLVISSSSTTAGRALVLKSAVSTNNSIFGRIVAEAQSSSIVAAGISFAIDGSTAAESRIDFSTSSTVANGTDVTRLRLDKSGNLQFRFGILTGANRDALLYIQESPDSDAGANVSVKAGSNQSGIYTGGSLYLAGGTGGGGGGKSGNVIIGPGFVPAAGSAMGGSVYLHPPLSNKTNVTGVAIGLAENSSVDAALVIKDVSDGIAGGDILQLKKSNDTTFFGFDSDGYLTKGLPYTNASDLSSVLSSSANNLDYYDEGDWSGTLQIVPRVTQSGWNSSVYKIVKSKYTRIGDTVLVDFVLKIDALSSAVPAPSTASDGYLYIKGFPYGADFSNVRLGTATNSYADPAMPLLSLKGSGFGNSTSTSGTNPVGTIQIYPGSTAPSGWMICNGASLSINSYGDLYNALGGSLSPYLSDDGFSSTFKIPDLAGKFVRGLGGNAASLGDTQTDDIKSHSHQISGKNSARNTSGGGFNVNQVYIGAYNPNDALSTSSLAGGSETRPVNMAMNYIIYTGSATGSASQAEFSGAFVNESSESRLYVYNGSGNLSVANIPSGSGVVSYLYGNFSYFTTSSTKY